MERKVVGGGVVVVVGLPICCISFVDLYLMPTHKLYCSIMVSHYPLLAEHH